MPYIKKANRGFVAEPRLTQARTSGELNYHLTVVVIRYLQDHKLSYQTCADIVSALDNCKDEFRRRIQHPYEDKKIKINGDVYFTEPKEICWSNELCANCGGYAGGSDGVCLSCAIIGKEAR